MWAPSESPTTAILGPGSQARHESTHPGHGWLSSGSAHAVPVPLSCHSKGRPRVAKVLVRGGERPALAARLGRQGLPLAPLPGQGLRTGQLLRRFRPLAADTPTRRSAFSVRRGDTLSGPGTNVNAS